ncbi:MAG: glutathione S-transferase N-terminal domain-containing protein [Parcubacteria group bacterium]|nr:glutathione S-transferase N-terminal domain-containing protein [Parcubacteria group bacterium]
MKKVKIYTTTTCMYCKIAKEFFEEKGVEYEEYNVGTDVEKRKEMLEISGQMGVPVITVEGEAEPIIGFDKPRLVHALGL